MTTWETRETLWSFCKKIIKGEKANVMFINDENTILYGRYDKKREIFFLLTVRELKGKNLEKIQKIKKYLCDCKVDYVFVNSTSKEDKEFHSMLVQEIKDIMIWNKDKTCAVNRNYKVKIKDLFKNV